MQDEWCFSTPEAQGLDSRLLDTVDDVIKLKRYRLVNSVLVVKNGCIVFEHYYNRRNENSRNNLKSVWKSILSIVVGICLGKGYIGSLDDPIMMYLPEFAKNEHPFHKLITVRHLLTMTSGIYWNGGVHYHCPMVAQMMRTRDWTAHMADIPVPDVPGTKYQYKEWDVMLLSAIISRLGHGTAYDIAEKYLYAPLNIQSGVWPSSPRGFSYTVMKGESASDLSARDMAKIGLLFLNDGTWRGQRIVSESYVKEAITPSENNLSYGYLWWLASNRYGCRGFGGQEVNVLPLHHMVTVVQATPTPSSKSYGDIHEEILQQAIL